MNTNAAMVQLDQVRLRLGPGVEFYCPEFRAAEGAHIALWGPSGCGKSTLLNIISGLLRPDEGRVIVNNVPLHELSGGGLDRFRGENLGFVFQTFNLLKPFTALHNVILGMRFSDTIPEKEWKERAIGLLERVGLGHRLHSKPSTLSVGEQQRVAIARALANKQKIIVADEPTGSLDPKTSQSVMDLLLELCSAEGMTLLLVTHENDIADRLPERFDCVGLVREVAR